MRDGGPVFPFLDMGRDFNGNPAYYTAGGLSLRDWFAGQALAGLLANRESGASLEITEKGCALLAYSYADAMLAAREIEKCC